MSLRICIPRRVRVDIPTGACICSSVSYAYPGTARKRLSVSLCQSGIENMLTPGIRQVCHVGFFLGRLEKFSNNTPKKDRKIKDFEAVLAQRMTPPKPLRKLKKLDFDSPSSFTQLSGSQKVSDMHHTGVQPFCSEIYWVLTDWVQTL